MQGGALIEGKHNVGAQLMLNLHRDFSGKAVHRAIEVAFKGDTFIINMGQPFFILCNHLIRAESLGIHR